VKDTRREGGRERAGTDTCRVACDDLERYRDIYPSVSEFMYEHDLQGRFIGISPRFVGFLGYSRDELLHMSVRQLLLQKDSDNFQNYIDRVVAHGRDEGLIQLVTKTGRKRVVEHKDVLVSDRDGSSFVLGIAKDVTDMLEAEQALVESEIRFRTILETIEDGYFEVDLNGSFTFFNDVIPKQSGYEPDELAGLNYRAYMDGSNARKVFEAFNNVFTTGTPVKSLEFEMIKKDRSKIFVEASVSLQRDRKGRPVGFCGIIRDITDRKRAEQELAYLAYHDALTGLHNRKAFHEKLEEVIRDARRYAVVRSILYIDLDHFMRVNDEYGHETGDRLLRDVANRLRTTLRESDYIGRLGGDEFAVILGGTHGSDPARVAQRVLRSLSKPYKLHDASIDFVTPSIGISTFPDHGRDAETILKHADDAMYDAKQRRNSYCIYAMSETAT